MLRSSDDGEYNAMGRDTGGLGCRDDDNNDDTEENDDTTLVDHNAGVTVLYKPV